MENKTVKAMVVLLAVLALTGCASSRSETAYETEPFFAGTPQAPIHPKSNSEKFFNKECKKVGNNSYTGNEYECWFSD